MEATPKRPQNKWDLIIGLFLIAIGSFRLYQHYLLGKEYSSFRILLTFGLIGFGIFNLYKFFTAPKS